jgi:hypothetical protein
MNFDELGLSTVKDSSAFKKIQFFSKTNTESIFNMKSDFESNYYRLSSLYNTDLKLMASLNYGISRQHNYNSLASTNKFKATNLDKISVDKFFDYNLNTQFTHNSLTDSSHVDITTSNINGTGSNLNFTPNLDFKSSTQYFLNTTNTYPTLKDSLNSETDSKKPSNPIKSSTYASQKKNLLYKDWVELNTLTQTDLTLPNPLTHFVSELFNKESVTKFKNLKSNDLQLLSSERNTRLLGNYNSTNYSHNFSKYNNDVSSISNKLAINTVGTNQSDSYALSQLR